MQWRTGDKYVLCCAGESPALRSARGIAICLWVFSGFLPQISSIAYAWTAFSVNTSISTPDGGDQIVQILAIMLIPVCVVDNRTNHWQKPRQRQYGREIVGTIGLFTLIAAKIQGFALYFHSSIGKLAFPTWVDGTEVYYDMHSPMFGPSYLLADVAQWFTSFPLVTHALTWAIVAVEFVLAIMPMTSLRVRIFLFSAGVAIHTAFGLFLGLWGFAFGMLGLLLLHAVPLRSPAFSVDILGSSISHLRPRRLGAKFNSV